MIKKCLVCGKELTHRQKTKRKLVKYCSRKCSGKWRSIHLVNVNHPCWKGDKVGYYGLHRWIRKYKPKSDICEICNRKKKLQLANKDHTYKRDVNDYMWLCSTCHKEYDIQNNNVRREPWCTGLKLSKKHIENLSKSHLGKIPWNKGNGKNLICSICNKEFYIPKNRIKKINYCSAKCYHISTKGKPTWNKGLKFKEQNYV